jgi:demethylmenaquinone methyltransferase/2-methoxy-6-polyprenyl-1,4-benzoquinol methylase
MLHKKQIWGREEDRSAHYDNQIRRNGAANFGYSKVAEDEKTQKVVRHFNSALNPGAQVLDVCGGTGDLAILAARAVETRGQVTVFDINRAMIDAGRFKKSNAQIRKRIAYVQGNAEQIASPDASFDAVMVGFGIRNVTHMEQGFREMYRVLKPGGKMMCLEFSKPANTVFRWLYDFYSFYIMPFLGQVIAGSRQAYTHLPESIRMFPLPDELADILRTIGYQDVIYRRLTNGIAVIHLAYKK